MSEDGFLARWARRKAQVQGGVVPGAEPSLPLADSHPPSTGSGQAKPLPLAQEREPAPSLAPQGRGTESEGIAPVTELPPPTLDDVAQLTPSSDFSRFVAPNVDEGVKRAAMKKLFSDPHFNVMDGLDTYIDDYGKPDPIPEAMLRRMAQSKFLGLFDHEQEDEAQPLASPDGEACAALPQSPTVREVDRNDEDPDLRLQQDDAAGPAGADDSARVRRV